MGTCKKRPQRDRGPRRAQGQAPCRILFCRHTASAPEPCRRPCLLDECALRGCRLLPETGPRIGNRFGNLQGYRQRDRPNNGDSACFRRPDPSGAFADPSRPPHPALSDAPACRTSTGRLRRGSRLRSSVLADGFPGGPVARHPHLDCRVKIARSRACHMRDRDRTWLPESPTALGPTLSAWKSSST